MNMRICAIVLPVLAVSSLSIAAPVSLSSADKAAAFKAAGYVLKGRQWHSECDDPKHSAGQIDTVRDLNGDQLPDAVIIESSVYCYGNSGTGYAVVSKQKGGNWKLITSSTGIPEFLEARGADGWPDISVGGPGVCFPVERWNGTAYRPHHFEFDGKPCSPWP